MQTVHGLTDQRVLVMETQSIAAINFAVLHYLQVYILSHKVQEDIFHWNEGYFNLQPDQPGSDKPGNVRVFHFRFEIIIRNCFVVIKMMGSKAILKILSGRVRVLC